MQKTHPPRGEIKCPRGNVRHSVFFAGVARNGPGARSARQGSLGMTLGRASLDRGRCEQSWSAICSTRLVHNASRSTDDARKTRAQQKNACRRHVECTHDARDQALNHAARQMLHKQATGQNVKIGFYPREGRYSVVVVSVVVVVVVVEVVVVSSSSR